MNVSCEWGGTNKDGWKAIPIKFIKHYSKLGISPEESIFIIVMHSFVKGRQKMFPKVDTVARRMGKKAGGVRMYIRSLRRKKLLITTRKKLHQEYDFTPMYEALNQLSVDCEDEPDYHDTHEKTPPDYHDSHPPYKVNCIEQNTVNDIESAKPTSPLAVLIDGALGRSEKSGKNGSSKKFRVSVRKNPKNRKTKTASEYNCNDVGKLLREKVRVKFGYRMANLTGKDRGQLKRMIAEFGAQETTLAAQQMVDKWEELASVIRVDGYPTVAILYGYRRQIIPWSTRGFIKKKPGWGAHFDKADERPDGEECGWSDEFLNGG